jgi:hypothetical protein
VVLTDDATEVERQLGSLAQFVGHSKIVVQPQTLRKLKGMLGDAPTPVHEALRVVEAECRLVVAGVAARLRDERRSQSLAAAAVAAGKSKLAQLDIEISVAEESLKKLKTDRGAQAAYVSGLERVEQECVSSVARVEEELNGYPEPLALLEEATRETAGGNDDRLGAGQQTEAKRQRADSEEEEHGTVVAKRQRGCSASAASSSAVDGKALLREQLPGARSSACPVADRSRGGGWVGSGRGMVQGKRLGWPRCR